MRILNVQVKYIIGGNPQVCLDYTRMLTKLGNQVTVLVNPKEPFVNELNATGADVIFAKRTANFGPYDLLTVLYFKKIIKSVKPDIIITHEGRLISLMKMAVGKKIPIIDVNHCRSPKQSKNTDATIVINTSRLNEYKKVFGQDRLVYHISNAIDVQDSIKPLSPRVWNDVPVIGVMSRFVYHKGIDIFIDALAILEKRNVIFKAKIVGDGPERKTLEDKVLSYKLQDKISMPGYEKDLDGFYNSIDIFCLPSRHEEFGLVVLWAYKYGIPTVVTNTQGPADIAENEKNSLVVPRKNPQALADALEKLLEYRNKADKLVEAAYEKLVARYSTNVVAQELQDALSGVIKNVKATV